MGNAAVSVEDDYRALRFLPDSLRKFLLFDADVNIDATNLVEAMNDPFNMLNWRMIERDVRALSRREYRKAYGGKEPDMTSTKDKYYLTETGSRGMIAGGGRDGYTSRGRSGGDRGADRSHHRESIFNCFDLDRP